MVDLSSNTSGGLIEHGFNNYVFLVSGILVATVVGYLIPKKGHFSSFYITFCSSTYELAAMAAAAEELENGADYADNSEEGLGAEGLDEAQERLKLMMDNLKAARQGSGIQIHYSVYLLAFVTIFTVVGFFAYKLVKSLQDKEKKREEKRKLKEQKKKK